MCPAVTLGAPQTTLCRSGDAVVHGAESEAVGVGMRAHLLHQRHDDVAQIGMQRLDRVHRRAQHRESLGDVGGIERTPEEVLEPPDRDVHAPPPCSAELAQEAHVAFEEEPDIGETYRSIVIRCGPMPKAQPV